MSKSNKYTWIYDKRGNAVKVFPPITSDGKEVKSTTQCGQLGSDVGFPNMRNQNKVK